MNFNLTNFSLYLNKTFQTNAFSMSFVKTKGTINILNEEQRIPARGKVLECAKKCNPKFCHCIRSVSNC